MTDQEHREFVRNVVSDAVWALVQADIALAKRIDTLETLLHTNDPDTRWQQWWGKEPLRPAPLRPGGWARFKTWAHELLFSGGPIFRR